MASTKTVERALRALTGLALAIAAAALLWPVSVPPVEIAPAGLQGAPPRPFPAHGDGGARAAVVEGNIFSSTRSAPRVRYRPLAPASEGVGDAVADDDAASGVPQLFGIVPGLAGAAALLRLDPGAPDAVLYRVGERGGRYRVEQIGEQSVVLSGPTGRVELRLPRPEEPVR